MTIDNQRDLAPVIVRRPNARLGWHRSFYRIYRFMRRWPVLPVLIIATVVFVAIFASIIAPHDPTVIHLSDNTLPPAWEADGTSRYILGTDTLGRDMLSRLMYGGRVSLTIAGIVLFAGATVGTAIGIISGYAGRATDELLMRIVDITLAVPFIMVALAIVVVFGQSFTVIIMVMIFFSWSGFARQIRAEILQLKTRDYVAMARICGASPARIMIRHLLPGITSTLLVIASLRVGQLILAESVLSYLGVGIPPPTPEWGLMISDGRSHLGDAWWIAFFPGMAIFLIVFAFNFLGDWLRDRFDPSLSQIVH